MTAGRHGCATAWLALVGLAGCSVPADDWNPSGSPPVVPRRYVCLHAASPLSIDGRLDETAWSEAPWSTPFVDIRGGDHPAPPLRTRVRLLWDDAHLYIGAEMEEPHVWGSLTARDSVIYQDDDFEVFIDPDGDNHAYFEVEINALNTVWDLFLERPYRDGGPARHEWDLAGMQTAVEIHGTLNAPADADTGWTVEMALPWAALAERAGRPCPPADGDLWRMNFSRVDWPQRVEDGTYRKQPGAREDNWVWSPQGAIDMHRPEQWGFVQFSAQQSGPVPLAPDHAVATRATLMRIYWAQRTFHAEHGHWAGNLEELGLAPDEETVPSPLLAITEDGYQASLQVRLEGGDTETWSVQQDSRLSHASRAP